MAISRMQQPRQMYEYGGLSAPRQNYGLGSFVKKAFRGVKKIVKSPLGKAAIAGAIGFGIPGTSFGGLLGRASFGGAAKGMFGNTGGFSGLFGQAGKFSKVGDMFRKDGAGSDLSYGKLGLGALGVASLAPLLMKGGDEDDVVDETVEQINPANQVARARNFYSGMGDKGVGLNFMPQKKYVSQNFYAADGGRAGYADGMMVEDEEEEFIRSGAGQSRRQQQTFLNMGGGAGNAQAEQMLMAEFVKYKNKGGDLSFEQFVKAVMQAQQEPEGAGMEQPQPVMMAA